jgi:hypothetical protein
MEWRQAIGAFRKAIDSRLKKDGYRYLGHNQWERPYELWRGHFAFEINPTNKGLSRRIFLSTTLRRTFKMSEADLLAIGERPVKNYTTYHTYTIWYPRHGPNEVRVETAEDLAQLAQVVVKSLDEEWIPWMISTAESRGNSLEGLHPQTHHVHPDVMYVP